MTVLSTDPPYSQYTGTGTQTYFEYGFDWAGQPVFVEVDGVPVTFTQQEAGVVLDTPPPLASTIVIFRKTDITQERDFQAFDGFHAAWTEDALDKLILLKQEAAVFRANMNLTTRQPVEGVWIDNSAGSDAFVQLWDGFSGMFSGEVTTQMPSAGSVVAKPEDFVYFQYGGGGGGGRQDYEYLMLRDSGDPSLLYFGADLLTGEVVLFGSTNNTDHIATDNTFAFTASIATFDVKQYAWRGHCWSLVMTDTYSSSNGALGAGFINGFDELLLLGTEAFGWGMRSVEYATSDPFALGSETTHPPDGFWCGAWDFRYTNKGEYEFGDALILTPCNGHGLVTYEVDGDALSRVANFAYGSNGNDLTTAHSVNRESGYVCTQTSTLTTSFYMTQVEDDLSITEIGSVGPTNDLIHAVTVTPSGFVITSEDSGGSQDYIRTYSRDGTTLTLVDEFTAPGKTSVASMFIISHRTDRIWLIGPFEDTGLSAYRVDDAGLIVQDIHIPNYNAYTNSSTGWRFQILDGPLNITSNGFTGIKEKLYECWEMNEVGSVTRVGAMGNQDLTVFGTVTNRSGTIGNAADFDGVSCLYASPTPVEMQAVSNFSVCLDVVVDALPGPGGGNQYFFVRGRNNASIDISEFDLGCYVTGAGIITFFVAVGTTYYTATHSTAISTGTKYHVYVEYDQEKNQIGLSVDDGLLQQTTVVGGINLHSIPAGNQFTVGRRTSWAPASEQQYLDGSIDQMYWFMDKLTSTERSWMYNSGNSRAFSEL